MRASGKKKPKKKKQPEQVDQAQIPRARGFYRPPYPSHEDLWGSERYMGAGENLHPAPPNAEQGEQNGERGRGPRSISALSLQMGNLLMAGHLAESERPVQPPRFDSRSQQNNGRGMVGASERGAPHSASLRRVGSGCTAAGQKGIGTYVVSVPHSSRSFKRRERNTLLLLVRGMTSK